MLAPVQMSDAVYEYILRNSLREPDVVRELRERTDALPERNMQVPPDQGQFLALLVRLLRVRQVLEVGVFTGSSTLWMALAMESGGRIVACDVSETWTAIAREHWERAGVAHRIELRLGRAVETLDRLLAERREDSFDLAFIDADKLSYEAYFERALRLVRRGGLIVIDNMLWSGLVAQETARDEETEALRRFAARLHRDSRIDLSLLGIADGLALAVRR